MMLCLPIWVWQRRKYNLLFCIYNFWALAFSYVIVIYWNGKKKKRSFKIKWVYYYLYRHFLWWIRFTIYKFLWLTYWISAGNHWQKCCFFSHHLSLMFQNNLHIKWVLFSTLQCLLFTRIPNTANDN